MTDIVVEKINEVYTRITAESSIHAELSAYFTFYAPNYQYTPLYKRKLWDGKIKLYKQDRLFYSGLLKYLVVFAQKHNYKITFEKDIILMNNFSLIEAK